MFAFRFIGNDFQPLNIDGDGERTMHGDEEEDEIERNEKNLYKYVWYTRAYAYLHISIENEIRARITESRWR